jgi:hypothetical protein
MLLVFSPSFPINPSLFCRTNSYILWPVPVFTYNILMSALPNHKKVLSVSNGNILRSTVGHRFFFHPLLIHISKQWTKHDSWDPVYSVFLSNSFQAFKWRLFIPWKSRAFRGIFVEPRDYEAYSSPFLRFVFTKLILSMSFIRLQHFYCTRQTWPSGD